MTSKSFANASELVLQLFISPNGEGKLVAFFRPEWWAIDTRIGIANWVENNEASWN